LLCSAKFATSSNFNRQFVTAILGLPRKPNGHKVIIILKRNLSAMSTGYQINEEDGLF